MPESQPKAEVLSSLHRCFNSHIASQQIAFCIDSHISAACLPQLSQGELRLPSEWYIREKADDGHLIKCPGVESGFLLVSNMPAHGSVSMEMH